MSLCDIKIGGRINQFQFEKTMNIKSLGLTELSQSEQKKVSGGIWAFVAGAILGGMIYDLVFNGDECVADFEKGWRGE